MKLRNYLRRISTWVLLLLSLSILLSLMVQMVTSDSWLQLDDFVEYWSAGRLNLNGGNPYDPYQMEELQAETGRVYGIPVMMWNPPWMLALAMPFGVMNYVVGRVMWLTLNFLLAFASGVISWRLYRGSARSGWVGGLIGLGFVPILQALRTGQSGVLILAGIVGFLYCIEQNNDFAAGMWLALATVKPHIPYLVFLAFVVWVWRDRRWKALSGLIVAICGSMFIVWIANPLFFKQYMYATTHFPPVDWATPTIGGALRLVFGFDLFWLQFVGPILGCAWLWLYWRQHGKLWRWLDHLPLLLVFSSVTAAYGWTSDHSVFLATMISVFAPLSHRRWKMGEVLLAVILILINLMLARTATVQIWLWWFGPSLLAWYIVARRLLRNS